MLGGRLPGWPSATWGCPAPLWLSRLAEVLAGPGGGRSGTCSKPPLTCLPTRQGKNSCFHRGHLRSINFLPLEPLPALGSVSGARITGPSLASGPCVGARLLMNALLFGGVTLGVPPPGLGPVLLTPRSPPIAVALQSSGLSVADVPLLVRMKAVMRPASGARDPGSSTGPGA